MTPAIWGGVLGGLLGLALVLVVSRLRLIGRPQLSVRVLPYLRDLPSLDRPGAMRAQTPGRPGVVAAVFGPVLRSLAEGVEKVLGGAASVRKRIRRADLDLTVQEFRVEQVTWGFVGFGVAAAYELLSAARGQPNPIAVLVVCVLGFVSGVLLRENHLSGQAQRRERQILQEFPTVAELLALAVAAGESPVAALDRVVQRSGGALSSELARVLAGIRTGQPVSTAFDQLASETGLPLVARFAQGIAVAVERGTPLADVLHAQAADVREAGRRELIEVAARREVFMMVPVVFLLLPLTIVFAFWPGVIGLSMTTP